jgi:hypothetical protein
VAEKEKKFSERASWLNINCDMYKNVILKYYPHGGFVLTLASNVVAIPDLNKKKNT